MIDDNAFPAKVRVSEREKSAVTENTDRRDPVFPIAGVEIGNVRSRSPALSPALVPLPVIDADALINCLWTRIWLETAVAILRLIDLAVVKRHTPTSPEASRHDRGTLSIL